MTRLRRRIARWLVGPFVNIPERDGTWVVSRVDGGTGTMIVEADKFRLRINHNLKPRRFVSQGTADEIAADFASWNPTPPTGRFVGTVRYS